MIDLTKAIGAVAASVAALGGSYTLADKFGWFDSAISFYYAVFNKTACSSSEVPGCHLASP